MDDASRVEIKRIGNNVVFSLIGNSRLSTSSEFVRLFNLKLKENVEIIIDLSRAKYIDSGIIGAFLLCTQLKKHVKFIKPSRYINPIIKELDLINYLTFYESIEEAVNAS